MTMLLRRIDRHVIRAYAFQYGTFLAFFLFMFTAIDFLHRLETFLQIPGGAGRAERIAVYYGSTYLVLFNLGNPAATVLATIFVLSAMERTNELLILRASGVSLLRAIRGLTLGAAICAGAAAAVQDWVLPTWGPRIVDNIKRIEKPNRAREIRPPRLKDDGGRLYYMTAYSPGETAMIMLKVTVQGPDQRTVRTYEAERATWEAGRDGLPGGWRLRMGKVTDELMGDRRIEPFPRGGPLLRSSLTPEEVESAVLELWDFLPWRELKRRAERQPANPHPRFQMHVRLVGPLYAATLFLLGLPFGLLGRSRGFLRTSLLCVVLCGSFYGTQTFCRNMATLSASPDVPPLLAPWLGAWMPVVLFLPIAIWFLRSVRT